MYLWSATMEIMQRNSEKRYMKEGLMTKTLVLVSVIALIGVTAAIYAIVSRSIAIANSSTAVSKTPRTVQYLEGSNGVLTNPYMGLAPAADSDAVYQPFSLVYAGVSWREIEPEKGAYNFEAFEKEYRFDYWRQKGVKFIIRLYMDYPSEKVHMDIPDWLYDEINKQGTWYNKDGNRGFSPDYSNKSLLENHKRLIEAMAKRYDNDNMIAFIELGSVGHWGEWNTTYIPKDKDAFPDTSISDMYVKDYIDNFKNKKLLMRRPYGIARINNFGLFNDSFCDKLQTEDYFLKWIESGYEDHNVEQFLPGMPEYWKYAPSGGEFSRYPGDYYLEKDNFQDTLNMLKKSHTSWLGPSCPAYEVLDVEKQENMQQLLKSMGYRFRISEVSYIQNIFPGQEQSGNIVINNDGVAPFYFQWPIYVSVSNSQGIEVAKNKISFDIRKLLPGKYKLSYSVKLPARLTKGNYNLKLYIVNPETGDPGIQFANVNDTGEKICLLGTFTVEEEK